MAIAYRPWVVEKLVKLNFLAFRYFVFSLAGLIALGVTGWWIATPNAKEASPSSDSGVAFRHDGDRLVVPEKSPLRGTIGVQAVSEQVVAAPFVLPASVEADPAKLVKVLPPIAGRIVSLNRRLGDAVKAGDVLFTIDSADLAQALSDARRAGSALALARQNIERQRELGASNIAAKRDIEQAQNDYEQTTSEFARANGRLAQLGLAGAHPDQGHVLTVRSPISGRVVDLNAAIGGYWNDTTAPIMTVADLSTVFVTASAQEKDLRQLYVGQQATVTLDAYPDQPLPVQVRYIGELLDPDTRTVKVRMVFDNPAGRFKPGMFAKAVFLGRSHSAIVVPMTAVVQSGFYSRAFVEVAPWQFEPRVLQLGPQIDDRVEVLSGLKVNDRVVVKEAVLLND
jgi:cobalt-zinc-cadmium efflux system membrane fusion protein